MATVMSSDKKGMPKRLRRKRTRPENTAWLLERRKKNANAARASSRWLNDLTWMSHRQPAAVRPAVHHPGRALLPEAPEELNCISTEQLRADHPHPPDHDAFAFSCEQVIGFTNCIRTFNAFLPARNHEE